ncbi:hypothetical protein [Hymenobacter psychrotolerans]|uniref:Uncharacterized protein n=1 Tax=Hymenobacter psychrotolerans DSM 18569 TaxID=1121959 RepID=A0A1M6Y576_9BACT|nr:hypothetical protein [Hymenobacter psychrotolerans]SHL13381.1 hypothetical protein SAMN02746009_02191 [Hymenobacter psychrotolerans DSM 18569]
MAVVFFLDPWPHRTLEDQVATASRGRYQLRIGELKTSLWQGAATVRHVQLFTAATSPAADTTTLPDIRLDLGELRVTGTLRCRLRRRRRRTSCWRRICRASGWRACA